MSRQKNESFNSVLERRNEAFRIIYDTVLQIENSAEKAVYDILCQNLRRIAGASVAAMAVFNKDEKMLTLEAVDDNNENEISKQNLRDSIVLDDDLIDEFKQNQVSECYDHNKCLIELFSNEVFKKIKHSEDSMCYRLSCVRGNNLVAAGFVKIGDGRKMKMKDMVDTYLGLAAEVIQRVETLRMLKNSEKKFRSLFQTALDGVLLVDESLRIAALNQSAEKIFNTSERIVIGRDISSIMGKNSDYLRKEMKAFKESKSDKINHIVEIEIEITDKKLPLEISIADWETDNRSFKTLIIRDITDRKRREQELKDSLKEKEALFKEVHHRVKNNLQIICSLLYLQSRKVKDETALQVLNDSRSRVRSMAIIHDKLYRSHESAMVDFKDYINGLIFELSRMYNYSTAGINLNLHLQDVKLPIDKAVPLGLIIHEIVTNTFKYAFPDDWKEQKYLDISLGKYSDKILLEIGDNGKGISEDDMQKNEDSIGMQLIGILIKEQLSGSFEKEFNSGTRYKISFPFCE